MITQPFASLAPHSGVLDVRFLTREDDVGSDDDIRRVTGFRDLVGLRQTHGHTAVRVREPSSRTIEADALATDVPGLALSIRFADCQNAVLFDPAKKVICLVHAGWRGVRTKVMTSAVELLQREWGVAPTDLLVALGPSLCTQCAEFTDPRAELPELTAFTEGRTVNLRQALDAEMHGLGIRPRNIERLPDCTRCRPDLYFTYRGGDREAVQNGKVNCLAVTLRKA